MQNLIVDEVDRIHLGKKEIIHAYNQHTNDGTHKFQYEYKMELKEF